MALFGDIGAIDAAIASDEWNRLQLASSVGNLEEFQKIKSKGADINFQSKENAVPKLCCLHIAIASSAHEIAKNVLEDINVNVNAQDQHGFTALHYAVFARNKELVSLLLQKGALTNVNSSRGSNPLEVARALKCDAIVDLLHSRYVAETDELLPRFREWLTHLGAAEYLPHFVEAGYDLAFVAKHGLTEEDLDCVKIPSTKRGLRRKIMTLYDLDKFYSDGDGAESEDEEEEGDEGEEGSVYS